MQVPAALAAVVLATAAHSAPLPQLALDPAETTVSGLSSGGFMAVQLHVAFSATFRKGAATVAGGPFYCAEGSIVNATGRCMRHDSAIPVARLVELSDPDHAGGAESRGCADQPSGLTFARRRLRFAGPGGRRHRQRVRARDRQARARPAFPP